MLSLCQHNLRVVREEVSGSISGPAARRIVERECSECGYRDRMYFYGGKHSHTTIVNLGNKPYRTKTVFAVSSIHGCCGMA